jgi:glycyl-tRNA synthetase
MQDLKQMMPVFYDEGGSIGKRYRRQDEAGTPYAITVDFDSLEDQSVTIRDRDTLKQERVKIEDINEWFKAKMISWYQFR